MKTEKTYFVQSRPYFGGCEWTAEAMFTGANARERAKKWSGAAGPIGSPIVAGIEPNPTEYRVTLGFPVSSLLCNPDL